MIFVSGRSEERAGPSDQVVNGDSVRHPYVHGDLGAVLWNFEAEVRSLNDLLVNASNFVADHETKRERLA